ncbi:MAG: DUF3619 family protein [Burkholderiaceae bacterium]|jgi:hypothetical protein|nr:DUF3619 family protein [Burkholderiaceae bacterium]
MNHSIQTLSDDSPDAVWARRITAQLDIGARDIAHDMSERLRVARERALDQHRAKFGLRPKPAVRAATAESSPQRWSWWVRIGTVAPILALVIGLVVIHQVQEEGRAQEVAEVDATLLTDDLPPTAYADPGFIQYLKGDDTATQ